MYLSSDSVWFDLILTTGVGGLLCVTLQHGRVMDMLLNLLCSVLLWKY